MAFQSSGLARPLAEPTLLQSRAALPSDGEDYEHDFHDELSPGSVQSSAKGPSRVAPGTSLKADLGSGHTSSGSDVHSVLEANDRVAAASVDAESKALARTSLSGLLARAATVAERRHSSSAKSLAQASVSSVVGKAADTAEKRHQRSQEDLRAQNGPGQQEAKEMARQSLSGLLVRAASVAEARHAKEATSDLWGIRDMARGSVSSLVLRAATAVEARNVDSSLARQTLGSLFARASVVAEARSSKLEGQALQAGAGAFGSLFTPAAEAAEAPPATQEVSSAASASAPARAEEEEDAMPEAVEEAGPGRPPMPSDRELAQRLLRNVFVRSAALANARQNKRAWMNARTSPTSPTGRRAAPNGAALVQGHAGAALSRTTTANSRGSPSSPRAPTASCRTPEEVAGAVGNLVRARASEEAQRSLVSRSRSEGAGTGQVPGQVWPCEARADADGTVFGSRPSKIYYFLTAQEERMAFLASGEGSGDEGPPPPRSPRWSTGPSRGYSLGEHCSVQEARVEASVRSARGGQAAETDPEKAHGPRHSPKAPSAPSPGRRGRPAPRSGSAQSRKGEAAAYSRDVPAWLPLRESQSVEWVPPAPAPVARAPVAPPPLAKSGRSPRRTSKNLKGRRWILDFPIKDGLAHEETFAGTMDPSEEIPKPAIIEELKDTLKYLRGETSPREKVSSQQPKSHWSPQWTTENSLPFKFRFPRGIPGSAQAPEELSAEEGALEATSDLPADLAAGPTRSSPTTEAAVRGRGQIALPPLLTGFRFAPPSESVLRRHRSLSQPAQAAEVEE